MHKPQGIDSVKLVGDTLEVYMKKKISLLRFFKAPIRETRNASAGHYHTVDGFFSF